MVCQDVGCLVDHLTDELESVDKVLEHLAEVYYKLRKLEQIETHGVASKLPGEQEGGGDGTAGTHTLDSLMTKLGLSRMGLFLAKKAKQKLQLEGSNEEGGTSAAEKKGGNASDGAGGTDRVVSTRAPVRPELPAKSPPSPPAEQVSKPHFVRRRYSNRKRSRQRHSVRRIAWNEITAEKRCAPCLSSAISNPVVR
jgi:hypothetical protein